MYSVYKQFMYKCGSVGMPEVCLEVTEQLVESGSLPFHYVASRDQTQVVTPFHSTIFPPSFILHLYLLSCYMMLKNRLLFWDSNANFTIY